MDCNEAIKILKDMKGVFGERSHSGYSLPAWDIYRDKQPYCMMCGKVIDWE